MFRHIKKYHTIPASPAMQLSLESVLTDYESIANSNPVLLREHISPDEVWRFFVDGIRQEKGWAKFEKNEPGYLKAMYKAFQAIFDFSSNIDTNFIKKLHKLTTEDVKETNYDDVLYSHDRGEFRGENDIRGGMRMNAGNVTTQGLYEALSYPNHPWLKVSIEFMDFNDPLRVIDIDKDSITKLRQFSAELKDPDSISFERLQMIVGLFCDAKYHEYIDFEHLRIGRLFSMLSQTTDTRDLVDCLHDLMQSREYLDESYRFQLTSIPEAGKVRESLNAEMDKLIRIYYRSNPIDLDPLKKLSAIISFVQACEQLHPFTDANCRVFCMLLLNHLLMRNGFPPAILEDPNRFDAYSRKELLQEVIRGMKNTLALMHNPLLYQCETTDCIETLKEKNRLGDIKLHEELVRIETYNRSITGSSLSM